MIDIPLSKAVVPVEVKKSWTAECCNGCDIGRANEEFCECMCCFDNERKDGKNVIFKLVDYSMENNGGNNGYDR